MNAIRPARNLLGVRSHRGTGLSQNGVFAGSTLMITGGTGSFGSTMLRHFLQLPVKEIRIVSRDPAEPVSPVILERRIRAARELRTRVLGAELGTAYRVFHSEGDGLPGVSVDRYGDHLVAQLFSPAILPLARTGMSMPSEIESVKANSTWLAGRVGPSTRTLGSIRRLFGPTTMTVCSAA